MDVSTHRGVFGALSDLEVKARSRKLQPQKQQQTPGKLLQNKVKMLMQKKDQLEAELQTHQKLQKRRARLDERREEGDEEMEEEHSENSSENSDILALMAKQTQLNDLLFAHHIIGGYDIVQTVDEKSLCLSLATAYEGTYLDTYNLEIELRPTLRIGRHNVPPFIPLSDIMEQNHIQTDVRGFLDALARHLNALAGRRQQLKLVKELHKSVEVLESNLLCSTLALRLPLSGVATGMICTLSYCDHARCLPTQVRFQCADEELPSSLQWKRNRRLLRETPLHKALTEMTTMLDIAEVMAE